MNLSEQQIKHAKQVIRKHYGLKRAVTTEEVIAEVKNLVRKETRGLGFDCLDSRLNAALGVGQHPIKVEKLC